MTLESVHRNAFPPPDRGRPGVASPPTHRQHQYAAASSQTAYFAPLPPLVFAILVAGLLVELRMCLAPPPQLPSTLPGIAVHGNTAAQSVLLWAEAHWPGLWALPVLCAGALGALRVAIWACGILVDGLGEGCVSGPGAADGVRVGRWEDGGSVSGSDLLAGVFT
ncbi:hypothetical protein EI94DRAFT_1804030 [Lactarius quietus]|nr:hypothetical protein EI94DRAFT_1804030 [Lactarius quietus]